MMMAKKKLKHLRNQPKQPHKPNFWDGEGKPIAIAHRGGDGAGDDKENTLKAFKVARETGYKYGETDVILSKDGQVMAIHGAANFLDGLLKRRQSRNGMQRKNLEKLRKKYTVGGEEIPTLEEVLLSQKKMRFLIDPKTEQVLEPLYKLLKRLNALDRVCVGSFNYQRVERFRQMAGRRPVYTSFIVGRALRVKNKNMDMLKAGRLKHIEAVQLHHSLISQQMVDLVHQQGFKALVWTANSELSIKNAIHCGADGIVSDRVHLLKEVIKANAKAL